MNIFRKHIDVEFILCIIVTSSLVLLNFEFRIIKVYLTENIRFYMLQYSRLRGKLWILAKKSRGFAL